MIEYIDYTKCTDCEACFDVCPMDVFRVHKIVYIAYPKDCMCCYLCEMACPEDCIFVGPERPRPIPLPYELQ